MRKPSRMPFFTQAFTASRSANPDTARPRAACLRSARFGIARTGREVRRRVLGRRLVEKAFDLSLQPARSPAGRHASSTFSIFAWLAAFGGHIGSRHTGCSSPISAIAAFTGIGFDSTKFTFISGRNFAWIRRAVSKSPRSARLRQLGHLARESRSTPPK